LLFDFEKKIFSSKIDISERIPAYMHTYTDAWEKLVYGYGKIGIRIRITTLGRRHIKIPTFISYYTYTSSTILYTTVVLEVNHGSPLVLVT